MPICLVFDGDIALARYEICGILMDLQCTGCTYHFAAAFVDWIYITDCMHVTLQRHLFAGYILTVFMLFCRGVAAGFA